MTLARTAGLLYLVVAAGGAFAIAVRARIVEPGNATATADNLRASAALFRAGFLSDLLAGTCFLLTVIVLYGLLRHVNELVAVAMLAIAAVGVAVGSLNSLNGYTALTIATGGDLGTMDTDRLAMLFVDAGDHGSTISYVFFALWLVPLGYLVIGSGFFPKVLGVALIVGCFGYLAGVLTNVLVPDAGEGILAVLGLVGGLPEVAFLVWLLVKGASPPVAAPRAA